MKALDGKLVKEYYEDSEYHTIIQDYIINVEESLENHKEEYEQYIDTEYNKKIKR